MVATKLIPKALQSASLQGLSPCCPGTEGRHPHYRMIGQNKGEKACKLV